MKRERRCEFKKIWERKTGYPINDFIIFRMSYKNMGRNHSYKREDFRMDKLEKHEADRSTLKSPLKYFQTYCCNMVFILLRNFFWQLFRVDETFFR